MDETSKVTAIIFVVCSYIVEFKMSYLSLGHRTLVGKAKVNGSKVKVTA